MRVILYYVRIKNLFIIHLNKSSTNIMAVFNLILFVPLMSPGDANIERL